MRLFKLAQVLKTGESLPPDRRSGAGWKNVLKGFGDILREKGFIPASLAYACSMSAIFCYISVAPFIIQQEYNLSGVQFSLIFAFNALVIACGSILSVKFSSVEKSLKFGALLAFSRFQYQNDKAEALSPRQF